MTKGTDSEYPVDEVARAWLTKMRGEEAQALRTEFEAWRAASPANRDAYARISKQMAAAAVLKSSARYGSARPRAGRRTRLGGWLPWGAMATAAALFLVAFGAGGASLPGFFPGGASIAQAAERLLTRRGEIRTFPLPGGSAATLDTDSRLDIAFNGDEQHVRLARGRVRLTLAAGAGAVRIEVGDEVMIARDADVDLSLDAGGQVRVVLLRGAAHLLDKSLNSKSVSALPVGKTLAIRMHGAERTVSRVADGDGETHDWPSGWVEYRSISLAGLVAEANRYAARPIVIDEPAVAELRVSGRFRVSDAEAFAARTARLFDLALVERHDGIHLRRR